MLTEVACRNARAKEKAQKLSDSGGLYLFVTPTGFKSWRLKYRVGKTEKRLILGTYPEMTLREARDRRDEARKQLRDGLDPSVERKKKKAAQAAGSSQTLQRFAEDWHAARLPGWRPHYAKAVLSRLKLDIFPALGSVPIGDVTAPMVLTTLQKIEKRGSLDVARRVRQHLSDVFRVAIAVGAAKYDPAAGLDRALKARTKRRRPAVQSIEQARRVMAAVEATNVEPTTRLASRLLALTAVRPAMVRLAEVEEFEDLDGPAAIWRIPAAKMKLTAERRGDLGFEFIVPLAPAAVDVVRTALASFSTKELLLPSARKMPMSDATLSKIYRSAGFTDVHVPHGWRATFSTVMNELAAIENRVGDRDVIDLMLAHVPSTVEAAYNRYAYLPRRRELALEWAELLMAGACPARDLIAARVRGRPKGPRHS
jgi:integrase